MYGMLSPVYEASIGQRSTRLHVVWMVSRIIVCCHAPRRSIACYRTARRTIGGQVTHSAAAALLQYPVLPCPSCSSLTQQLTSPRTCPTLVPSHSYIILHTRRSSGLQAYLAFVTVTVILKRYFKHSEGYIDTTRISVNPVQEPQENNNITVRSFVRRKDVLFFFDSEI